MPGNMGRDKPGKRVGYKFGDSALGKLFSGRLGKDSVKGTVRSTGAGRTGEKGEIPVPPVKSAKMAAMPKMKAMSGGELGAKPKLVAAKVNLAKPRPAKTVSGDFNRRSELGDFYLSATEHMFSEKAGGKKKR